MIELNSMTASCLTEKNMFDLPHCLVCGIAQLPRWSAGSKLVSTKRDLSRTCRNADFLQRHLRNRVAYRLLIGPSSIIRPTLAASTRIVFCSNSPCRSGSSWSRASEARGYFENKLRSTSRDGPRWLVLSMAGHEIYNARGAYFLLLVSECRD